MNESRHKTAPITGSSGLIGSESVVYFDRRGWRVEGVDSPLTPRADAAHGRHILHQCLIRCRRRDGLESLRAQWDFVDVAGSER